VRTRDDGGFFRPRSRQGAQHGYRIVGRTGSHVQLRYEHPDTGEVRNVTVPMYNRLDVGVLQSIANQCGADDFDKWCEWIDRTR